MTPVVFHQLFARLIENDDMYVTSVPNRRSPPCILLRESYREEGKFKNRTIVNLTHVPSHMIEVIKRAAKNEALVGADDIFHVERSFHHGHVDAVLTARED